MAVRRQVPGKLDACLDLTPLARVIMIKVDHADGLMTKMNAIIYCTAGGARCCSVCKARAGGSLWLYAACSSIVHVSGGKCMLAALQGPGEVVGLYFRLSRGPYLAAWHLAGSSSEPGEVQVLLRHQIQAFCQCSYAPAPAQLPPVPDCTCTSFSLALRAALSQTTQGLVC